MANPAQGTVKSTVRSAALNPGVVKVMPEPPK
jgi:hypothetical protein